MNFVRPILEGLAKRILTKTSVNKWKHFHVYVIYQQIWLLDV